MLTLSRLLLELHVYIADCIHVFSW